MGSVGSAWSLDRTQLSSTARSSKRPVKERGQAGAQLKERGQGILPFLLPMPPSAGGDPRDGREANPIGERSKSAAVPHTLHLPSLLSISSRMQKIGKIKNKEREGVNQKKRSKSAAVPHTLHLP